MSRVVRLGTVTKCFNNGRELVLVSANLRSVPKEALIMLLQHVVVQCTDKWSRLFSFISCPTLLRTELTPSDADLAKFGKKK